MRTLKALVFCMCIIILFQQYTLQKQEAANAHFLAIMASDAIELEEKQNIIDALQADNDGLRHELLLLLVERCESSFRHKGVYGAAGEYGRYQYMPATFEWFKKLSGMEELDWKCPDDQETLTRWAFQNGLQNHWTCYGKVAEQYPLLRIDNQ